MKLIPIGVGLLLLGIVFILASFIWNSAVPNEAIWSEEQAVAYQKKAWAFHQQQFDDSVDKLTLKQTKSEYESQREAYDRARNSRTTIPFYLRVVGVVLVIVGVGLISAQQNQR